MNLASLIIGQRKMLQLRQRVFMVCARRNAATLSDNQCSRSSSDQRQKLLDRIIRVDHAGELGADRIYAGQMFVLGNTSAGPLIQHMWDQEKEHLATFERLIPQNRVRPSALLPLWNIVGFGLGLSSALLGKEAAMACTEAVEAVIGEHYNDQIRDLMADDQEAHKTLLNTIQRIRDEEMEHHDAAIENDSAKAPFYKAFKQVVQFGCRRAIWISERF